jgi:EAL domain-containing protein (putative c-di-GMP-specific phosphodiesterase class I)
MFPFDKVKIDQSFVREMIDNPQARAIIRSVIGLGRGLGMPVVAEGVETAAQLEALRAEGCDQVQGYLIARPNPIGHFEGVVMNRSAAAAMAKVVPIRRRA